MYRVTSYDLKIESVPKLWQLHCYNYPVVRFKINRTILSGLLSVDSRYQLFTYSELMRIERIVREWEIWLINFSTRSRPIRNRLKRQKRLLRSTWPSSGKFVHLSMKNWISFYCVWLKCTKWRKNIKIIVNNWTKFFSSFYLLQDVFRWKNYLILS